jgi:hypothetical protein
MKNLGGGGLFWGMGVKLRAENGSDKRYISLVRHSSEKVIILRSSQVDTVVLIL